jgi:Uma2 family endonuclease
MSTLRTHDRMSPGPEPEPDFLPRLKTGDRMDSATFMTIYERMPEGFRAQLIRGVVYVALPMSADHGGSNSDVSAWLGAYRAKTPGVRSYAGSTIRLGPQDNPEPDAALVILPGYGGQARIDGKYLDGAPELVIEVSYSTQAYDLNDKLAAYREAGVREYVVVLGEDRIEWLVLRDGRYETHAPEPDGLLRSTVFPGLWLDAPALLAGDIARLFAAVDRGTSTPEHAAFVARLAEALIGK